MKTLRLSMMFLALAFAARCSSSAATSPGSNTTTPAYQIVAASGGPLQALAGDALALQVVQTTADGGTAPLPAAASVSWTLPATITALPADDDTDPSPLPAAGPQPTGVFVDVPTRADRSDPAGLLYVLDPGTVQNAVLQVSATVSGLSSPDAGELTASVGVSPAPAGDWTRGAALYGSGGANCAECHGPTGHGTAAPNAAGAYVILGVAYDFPAPGLNAELGNLGGDPAWNAALLAFSARSDADNGGVTLRFPMPDWLTRANPTTGAPLSTQDFADIYAFLKTQTQ